LVLVALANFMRLSLLKAAHAVVSSAAWQEIRVRSGRDDNSVAGRDSVFPRKVRGTADPSASLGMTKGRVAVSWKLRLNRIGPATTLCGTVALSFVIPSEAEGSAVPRTFRGNVFRQIVASHACRSALQRETTGEKWVWIQELSASCMNSSLPEKKWLAPGTITSSAGGNAWATAASISG
jgi:hypothetical protein